MKNPCKFISIVGENGRVSSLEISGERIKVVGGLYHCDNIEPQTIQDADALIEWLNDWKKRQNYLDKYKIG